MDNIWGIPRAFLPAGLQLEPPGEEPGNPFAPSTDPEAATNPTPPAFIPAADALRNTEPPPLPAAFGGGLVQNVGQKPQGPTVSDAPPANIPPAFMPSRFGPIPVGQPQAEAEAPAAPPPPAAPADPMADNMRQQGDIEAQAAEESYQTLKTAVDRDRELAAKNQLKADQDAVANEKMEAELKQDAEALAGARVDPGHVFGEGMGKRIAAALMVFAGGLGSRATGGRNLAMETINNMIERDIDAQKANIANQRGALNEKQSLYQQTLARTGNEARARELHRAAAWDAAINQAKAEAMKYESPRIKAKFGQQILEMEAARAAATAKAMEEARKQWLKEDLDERKQRVDEFNAASQDKNRRGQLALDRRKQDFAEKTHVDPLAVERAKMDLQMEKEERDIKQRHGVGGVEIVREGQPPIPYLGGGSQESYNDVVQIVAGRNVMQKAIKEAKKVRGELGMEWWSRVPDTAKAQIVRAYANTYGLKQTTAQEQLEADLASGGHIGGVRNPTEALDALGKNTEVWAQEQLKARASGNQPILPGDAIRFAPYDGADEGEVTGKLPPEERKKRPSTPSAAALIEAATSIPSLQGLSAAERLHRLTPK